MTSDPIFAQNQSNRPSMNEHEQLPLLLNPPGETASTKSYDLGIAWNWEYDADFIKLIENSLSARSLSLLQITPDNVENLTDELVRQKIHLNVFFDRASEDDSRFIPIVKWACTHCSYFINRHEWAIHSCDKTTMHYTLIHAGLHTPYTIMLPSYDDDPNLPPFSLHPLGERFIIKPSIGGGGEGVVTDLTSMNQILELRRQHTHYRYLLQTFIEPVSLGDRPAWFRVLYCRGTVFCCWWHPDTHVYAQLTAEEEYRFQLQPLIGMTKTIADLCKLDIFSTEIALTADGRFVVVDYVNDQPDLRLQSQAADGVPDIIVQEIAAQVTGAAAEHFPAANGDNPKLHDDKNDEQLVTPFE